MSDVGGTGYAAMGFLLDVVPCFTVKSIFGGSDRSTYSSTVLEVVGHERRTTRERKATTTGD